MTNPGSRLNILLCIGLYVFSVELPDDVMADQCSRSPKGNEEARSRDLPFELMICDYVQFKLSRVDKRGKTVWQHQPAGKVWDFVLIDGNRVVYPMITDQQEVRCIDFDENVRWSWPSRSEFREIVNITRHRSRLIVSGQMPPQAILMDFDGKIRERLPIPTTWFV